MYKACVHGSVGGSHTDLSPSVHHVVALQLHCRVTEAVWDMDCSQVEPFIMVRQ